MTHVEIQTGSPARAALIPRDLDALPYPIQVSEGDTTGSISLAEIPEYAYRFVGEYKTPIGPKDATDHERNPINTVMLDIARQAIYAPDRVTEMYPDLLERTREAYRTGGIKPTKDEAGYTPDEMAYRHLLSGISEKMAALADGADVSLFEEQIRTIQLQAMALKQGAIETEDLRGKLRGHFAHALEARAFLVGKLSPEDLALYDEKYKAGILNVPIPEARREEHSSGMERFVEILQHAGFPKGWLKHIPFLTK